MHGRERTAALDGSAPRIALLLPVALLLHVAEEWFGGFPAWTATVLGDGVSDERFLAINAVGLVLFTAAMLAAVSRPGAAWLAVSLAALLGVNGVLHALATVWLGRYAPGVVTGLLLSVPLSVAVLRSSARRLRRSVFAGAAVVGLLVHGVVTAIALS